MRHHPFLCALIIMVSLPAYSQEPETPDAESVVEKGDSEAEDLQEAKRRIEREQQFSRLRKERRDILQAIPVAKNQVDELQNQISRLRAESEDAKTRMQSLNSDRSNIIARYRSSLDEWTDRRAALEDQDISDLSDADQAKHKKSLEQARNAVDFYTKRLRDAEDDQQRDDQERQMLELRQMEIAEKLPPLEKSLLEATQKHGDLLEKQFLVEDAINVMLIPETARNQFKLYITAAFSSLVGLVILGFFFVSWQDQTVRRSIFSSQSGIQFLTLFSLVIAIILFGITNILGGKELAALLGGISGYILGRVTDHNNSPSAAPPEASR